MAIRKIVPDSDPLIHKVSKPVNVFDENLWQLLDDMKETMQKMMAQAWPPCKLEF